jgi:hypothetical protein
MTFAISVRITPLPLYRLNRWQWCRAVTVQRVLRYLCETK